MPPSGNNSVTLPGGESVPVVFDSPHSGLDWPPDFRPVAPRAAVLSTWDAFVDELWGDVPAHGATLIAARFPRAYIDANRAADDLDPALLAAPWPGLLATSDYSRRGMGLIRRYALPDVPMYAQLLTVAEVRHRLEDYYQPYRDALRARLDELYAKHGTVWHVNCHSMKSRGNRMNTDDGALRPDFVISDREGRTSAPAQTAWVAEYFSALGYRVRINSPYLGGDIIAAHGDPARHRHSIQIEINRALYMDEATCTRGVHFGRLREELTGFAGALADRVRAKTAIP